MQIQPEMIKKLKLPAAGQLGIVVKSIDRVLPYYKQVMNIRPFYRANIVEQEIYYKDHRVDFVMDIAIGYSGALQIELIEVVKGDENDYTKFINEKGQGLHHVGFVVSDVKKKTEILQRSGITPIQYGTLKTKGKAVTRYAYFDTRETCGYLLELIETTLFGIPVGQSHFMIKVGSLLGDIDKT